MKVPYFMLVAQQPNTLNYKMGGGDFTNLMNFAAEIDKATGLHFTMSLLSSFKAILEFLDNNPETPKGYVLLEGKPKDNGWAFKLIFNGWVEDGNEQSEVP